MKWIRLTAYSTFIMALLISFTACEKNSEKNKVMLYQRTDIPMTGAQETPANASTALGSMDVSYNKETRLLTYTVRWSGLTDSISLMHIHGLAPVGFTAPAVQNIIGGTAPSFAPFLNAAKAANNKSNFPKTGTYSGNLLADGVLVKEQDILNGSYYMNIHTNAYPAGEIRGQIIFQ